MTKTNSTKPAKPYPEFPLFAHATKRWAKKIKGKLHYFGPWDDPDGALQRYLDQKDDLYAGRRPRSKEEKEREEHGITIKDLCNRFLTMKKRLMDTEDLSPRTHQDYVITCQAVADQFKSDTRVSDLTPADFEKFRFEMANRLGPVRLGNEINRVRILFKYAYDDGHIKQPVRYGQGFKRPTARKLRKHRREGGKCLYTPEEIHRILGAAGPAMKAMVMLGCNCGFGNSDCGNMQLQHLDLDGGWVDYARPKTEIDRRCPLWPETVQAIRDYLAVRPKPKNSEDAQLVFVTKYGESWAKETKDYPTSKEMAKLLKELGINGRRRLGFYALRHTFETIAGGSKDQVAVNAIMGHVDNSMAATYREGIDDKRLVDVAEHVRLWLYPASK